MPQLSSLADETPEGRSIVVLAKQPLQPARARHAGAPGVPVVQRADADERRRPVPQRTSSGAPGREIRKARRCDQHYVESHGGHVTREVDAVVTDIARRGSTPLAVAERVDGVARVLGVIELKDIVKGGIGRFAELRKMGIKTVMVTGDNRLTAAAIAAEAGVDDFLAEATPETKLATIREHIRRQGPSGRDDRRRHQRRAGARAGRRGGRDEHRRRRRRKPATWSTSTRTRRS